MNILKMIGIGFLILLLIVALFIVYRFVVEGRKSQSMSPDLGVTENRLKPCPSSPNCVSSYETDKGYRIQAFEGDQSVLVKLAEHIGAEPNALIVEQRDDYLYATYQSRLFGFVDDLEFYFDGAVIQVRSASRVGHSDLGANRKRVEALRLIVNE